MIPVDQTKLHIPGEQNGNCMNAAIASILEIAIEDIPCFEDMEGGKWYPAFIDWLYERGFELLRWDVVWYPKGYFIANGTSPRGVEHSVVYKETEMVHDPHPSRDGIEAIKSVWVFLPIDPSRFNLLPPFHFVKEG